ncbi:hypothetical protein J4234_01840 [Candidatus Woesearchaeota archaeon]|nr:hypothetical protein [Candidatus Woesearchaeota archaeon]
MFWKKDNTEKKISQMNDLLKKSFENVKRDTTGIFQWMNYFYRRGMEQEQLIKRLQLELSYMPKTREDIRRIIDDYYSFESIMAKISELNYKIDELARKHATQAERSVAQPVHKEVHHDMSYIEKRLEMLEQKKMSIKEKIMRKLTRNSKEYVKSVILSYIRKYERISALQLKEIVVDEQNFCSKSSFYRLLEEIEELDEIGVVKQGKEKHYISKAIKRI